MSANYELEQAIKPRVWSVKNPERPRCRYVGRGSRFGNPFVIGRDGDRAEVIRLFCEWVLPTLDVEELRDCDLECHCSPLPCHADWILRKANHAY